MKLVIRSFLLFFLFTQSIFASGYIDFEYRTYLNKKWLRIYQGDKQSVQMLIDVLKNSDTGKRIVLQAMRKARRDGNKLEDVILPGDGSLTDTTLIRKFSPTSPEEIIYETRSVVYIDKYHSLKDALLDLAHELTHFVYREPFNPYRNDFSFKEFLTSTVEGRGGEVDAYLIECRVSRELFGNRQINNSDCFRVQNHAGHFSKRLAVKEFYKVGNNAGRYWNRMAKYGITKDTVPWLSDDQAHFISSAYSLPYPLAAYEEYMNIMTKVCENDSKRLSLMSSSALREPASERNSFRKLKHSFNARCSKLE